MILNHKIIGNGFPVIILHGLFGSLDNWQGFARQLSEYNFKVITADLRNHGRSFHDPEFTLESMARDINVLIRNLGLDKIFLIGHSLGGKVALEVGKAHPELLKGMVVLDIAPRYYPVHHQRIIQSLRNVDLKNIDSRQGADNILKAGIPEVVVRQFLLKNLYRTEHGYNWRFNLNVISDKIENVGQAVTFNSPVTTPTLFMKGDRSDYITYEDEKNIYLTFNSVNVETCENSGHWLHADNPECVLRQFLNFSNAAK